MQFCFAFNTIAKGHNIYIYIHINFKCDHTYTYVCMYAIVSNYFIAAQLFPTTHAKAVEKAYIKCEYAHTYIYCSPTCNMHIAKAPICCTFKPASY